MNEVLVWIKQNEVVISLMSFVLSVVAIVESKRPYNERRMFVYQKLNVLKDHVQAVGWTIQMQIKEGKNQEYMVPLDGTTWEHFGLTKDEEIEFALLDLKYRGNSFHSVAIPRRLKLWFGMKLKYIDHMDQYFLEGDLKRMKKLELNADRLVVDVKRSMGLLRKQFSIYMRLNILFLDIQNDFSESRKRRQVEKNTLKFLSEKTR